MAPFRSSLAPLSTLAPPLGRSLAPLLPVSNSYFLLLFFLFKHFIIFVFARGSVLAFMRPTGAERHGYERYLGLASLDLYKIFSALTVATHFRTRFARP